MKNRCSNDTLHDCIPATSITSNNYFVAQEKFINICTKVETQVENKFVSMTSRPEFKELIMSRNKTYS